MNVVEMKNPFHDLSKMTLSKCLPATAFFLASFLHSPATFANGWINSDLVPASSKQACIDAGKEALMGYSDVWPKMGVSSNSSMVVGFDAGMKGQSSSNILIMCNEFDGKIRPMIVVKSRERNASEEDRKEHLNAVEVKFNRIMKSKNRRVTQ